MAAHADPPPPHKMDTINNVVRTYVTGTLSLLVQKTALKTNENMYFNVKIYKNIRL